jgi:hypothetical protein
MTERRVRHLPVFDNSELIGMVTLRDLIKYRLQEIELEATSSATWQSWSGSNAGGFFGSVEPSHPPLNRDVPAVPTTLMF